MSSKVWLSSLHFGSLCIVILCAGASACRFWITVSIQMCNPPEAFSCSLHSSLFCVIGLNSRPIIFYIYGIVMEYTLPWPSSLCPFWEAWLVHVKSDHSLLMRKWDFPSSLALQPLLSLLLHPLSSAKVRTRHIWRPILTVVPVLISAAPPTPYAFCPLSTPPWNLTLKVEICPCFLPQLCSALKAIPSHNALHRSSETYFLSLGWNPQSRVLPQRMYCQGVTFSPLPKLLWVTCLPQRGSKDTNTSP